MGGREGKEEEERRDRGRERQRDRQREMGGVESGVKQMDSAAGPCKLRSTKGRSKESMAEAGQAVV